MLLYPDPVVTFRLVRRRGDGVVSMEQCRLAVGGTVTECGSHGVYKSIDQRAGQKKGAEYGRLDVWPRILLNKRYGIAQPVGSQQNQNPGREERGMKERRAGIGDDQVFLLSLYTCYQETKKQTAVREHRLIANVRIKEKRS